MSGGNVREYSFLWKIQNFSFLFGNNSEKLKSPVLTVGNFGESQWQLELHLDGFRGDGAEFISLYLRKNQNDFHSEESVVRYALEMNGGDGKSLKTARSRKRVFKENSCFGWRKFVRRSKVNERMKCWEKDILTIRCQIYYEGKQNEPLTKEVCTEIAIEKRSFLWNVKVPDILSLVNSKVFTLSKNSLYLMALSVSEDKIKINIHQILDEKSKLVHCNISLLNSDGHKISSKVARFHFPVKSNNRVWTFPSFISKMFLDSNKNAFVEKNTISLLCKFAASDGSITEDAFDLRCDTDPRLVLVEELKRMFLSSAYSDVQLKTSFETLQAHKSILAARSPVFAAMFRQDMIETQTSVVDIPDVEADTLKSFLEFIYTGAINDLDYEGAKKLIMVADKYQVLTLTEKCVSLLESFLSLGTACEMLFLADMIGHKRLKKSTLNFVATNSTIMINLPEFTTLVKNNPHLGSDMIQLMHTKL